MKLLLTIISSIFVFHAWSMMPGNEGNFTRLSCAYNFDSPHSMLRAEETFYAYPEKGKDGTLVFTHKANVPSYYISNRNGSLLPQWHHKAQFKFAAKLKDEFLTYGLTFSNYVSAREYKVVKQEVRELPLGPAHSTRKKQFYFDQGRVITLIEEPGSYINTSSVAIKKCTFESYDFEFSGGEFIGSAGSASYDALFF